MLMLLDVEFSIVASEQLETGIDGDGRSSKTGKSEYTVLTIIMMNSDWNAFIEYRVV